MGIMSDTMNSFLPPASFEFLVMSLRTQAEVQLGLLHLGTEEERPEPQLPLARHAIDLLAMLVEKTRGNLSLEEQRLLENSVTELRFQYVHVSEKARTAKVETGEAQTNPATPASAEAPQS